MTVKGSFVTDAHYLASEQSKPFTIAKETMQLEYTGTVPGVEQGRRNGRATGTTRQTPRTRR